MDLYELRNDTCFLSVMSRNFTDYATIPSLTSGMLWNFTNCATMHPFDSQHVAELHGLPNVSVKYLEAVNRRLHATKQMVPRRN